MHRPQWSRFVAVVVTALAALPAVAAPAGADTPTLCPDAGGSVFGGFPLPPGTGEASGLVASTRHPGWGWVIRDSGNPPDLYAVRFPGAVAPHALRAIRVLGATNVDWEDISEQDGRLYVTESDQSRRARYIYEIPEPDPLGPPRVHFSARYRYAYPNGQRVNTETTFFFAGHFVLVPKTTPAQLYRFDHPLRPDRVNVPRFVGRLPGSDTVSLARVSPDGRTLVLANHEMLFAYRTPASAVWLRDFVSRPVHRKRIDAGDNVEGGDFFPLGRCKLVLVAESRDVYRLLLPR
ncbi:MAG TPA: hypothetical protein VJ622_03645 [Acidimicrobiia bacterium]|nr:hypothetical protein [Acidimicrobiia bacterium]